MENNTINKEVLDVINEHLGELDSEGLYPFTVSVLSDGLFNLSHYSFQYTLGVFLMRLFDDDVDELVKELCDSGFHKWSTFDEWNEHYGKIDIQRKMENTPESTREGCVVLPKSDMSGYVTVDYSKYKDLVDFSSSHYSDPMHVFNKDLPFVDSFRMIKDIDKSVWDKLYVAVFEDENLYGHDTHYAIHLAYYSGAQTLCYGDVYYITIKEAIDYLIEWGVSDWEEFYIATALPKEIVEKYNLPIGRNY